MFLFHLSEPYTIFSLRNSVNYQKFPGSALSRSSNLFTICSTYFLDLYERARFSYPIIQRYHHGTSTLSPALIKLFHKHFIASAAFLFLCLGSLLFTSIPANSLCDPPERRFLLSRARTLAFVAHVLIIYRNCAANVSSAVGASGLL